MAEKMVQSNKQKNSDDVLELNEDSSKRRDISTPSKSGKGKQGKKVNSTPAKNVSKSITPVPVVVDVHANHGQASPEPSQNDQIMTLLRSIQDNQRRQDNKISNLSSKVTELYEYDDGGEDYYEDDSQNVYDIENYDDEPPSKKQRNDLNNNQDEASISASSANAETSRFATMSKRFKQKEICDENIDEVLAKNLTDFFRNGMDETQFQEMTKDENNARPENCEGLSIVRTNQLVWDVISPFTQTCDKKMQNIEKSVIKAAIILANAVDKIVKVESDKRTDSVNELIDSCNDVLALMGHTNRQINLTRRDFIRTELNSDYVHLCAQSVPYTNLLFGDDVSKTAKDIEDCSKIGNRIHGLRGGFGRNRGRFPRNRGGRRGRSRGRGRGHFEGRGSYDNYEGGPKNYPRRGGSRGQKRV